jgi:hypothetical protein
MSLAILAQFHWLAMPSSKRYCLRAGVSVWGCCGDAGGPETRGNAFTMVVSSLPSVLSSPPSKERLFPSLGGSTRAWNAFPEALGRGARSWRCLGGISRGGVSEIT